MVIVKEKPKAPLEPPPRELSALRVAVLLVVLWAIGFGVWQLASKETPAASAKSDAVPVYAPYVDVTNTPTYPFQLPSSNPVSSVYLSFIVSDTGEPCTPSWGTFYTLNDAEQGLDLDARTAQLRSQGGSVMISYGGAGEHRARGRLHRPGEAPAGLPRTDPALPRAGDRPRHRGRQPRRHRGEQTARGSDRGGAEEARGRREAAEGVDDAAGRRDRAHRRRDRRPCRRC